MQTARNCLALHGPRHSLGDLRGWLSYVAAWSFKRDLAPNVVSITVGQKERKYSSVWRAISHLEKVGPEEVASVQVVHAPPTYRQLVFDWHFTAGIVADAGICFFCFPPAPGTDPFRDLAGTAGDLGAYHPFTYGYGYQRDLHDGPALYALGIGVTFLRETEEQIRENQRIAQWVNVLLEQGPPRGHLRDLYPLNYLSSHHLNKRIGRQTLRTWISGSGRRGALQPLNESIWEWRVPPRYIPQVREKLIEANLLVSYWPSPIFSTA